MLASIAAVILLSVVHVFAAKMRFLEGVPRSRWLSADGGISVAYVFLHLLPELNESQKTLESAFRVLPFLESHVYLVAVTGLVVVYGVERTNREARPRQQEDPSGAATSLRVFWISILWFAVYNAIIGYLVVQREEQGIMQLTLFAIAMGVHFLVTDYGLREHHKGLWSRIGRWTVVTALILGWVIGAVTEISELALGILIAFLGGGVILNVLKEELPEERQSRFSAFTAGLVAYAVLLLAL